MDGYWVDWWSIWTFHGFVSSIEGKVWVSEKATKFEKNLFRTFDKSVVFCAHSSVCQKVDEDFSKQMWSSRIIQTLRKVQKKL